VIHAPKFVFAVLIASILSGSNAVMAQQGGAGSTSGGAAASGKQEFREYCAQCHGSDGTGNGPVAPELKRKPANLTVLARNNGGVFPTGKVRDFIVGTKATVSHGTREMPIWGYAFMFRPGGMAGPFVPVLTPQEADDRINRLVDYVRSIQQK
jgi:mono/diheme cytochrome c family protein